MGSDSMKLLYLLATDAGWVGGVREGGEAHQRVRSWGEVTALDGIMMPSQEAHFVARLWRESELQRWRSQVLPTLLTQIFLGLATAGGKAIQAGT